MTQPITSSSTTRCTCGSNSCAVSLGTLVLRLTLGFIFVYHGAQKLFGIWGGPGIEAFSHYLGSMPTFLSPIAWAYMAALGEFVGGISVLLGLLARLGAIPIIITMLVAIATVVGKNGFSGYMDPIQGWQMGYEYNVALIAMSAYLVIAGPGKLSLDALLVRGCRKTKPAMN